MNCRAAPFICENLGTWRAKVNTLYVQDKSSKMKISIYTYWKLAEPRHFKQLQNTAPQALIDSANIWTATWLYNIVLSENLASWILAPRSSHLETRSVRASRPEDRVSSFDLRVSTCFWTVLYLKKIKTKINVKYLYQIMHVLHVYVNYCNSLVLKKNRELKMKQFSGSALQTKIFENEGCFYHRTEPLSKCLRHNTKLTCNNIKTLYNCLVDLLVAFAKIESIINTSTILSTQR